MTEIGEIQRQIDRLRGAGDLDPEHLEKLDDMERRIVRLGQDEEIKKIALDHGWKNTPSALEAARKLADRSKFERVAGRWRGINAEVKRMTEDYADTGFVGGEPAPAVPPACRAAPARCPGRGAPLRAARSARGYS